jgi:hypothetical protein
MTKPKSKSRPSLALVGSRETAPTLDDVLALTQHVAGREPTPHEIESARQVHDHVRIADKYQR